MSPEFERFLFSSLYGHEARASGERFRVQGLAHIIVGQPRAQDCIDKRLAGKQNASIKQFANPSPMRSVPCVPCKP